MGRRFRYMKKNIMTFVLALVILLSACDGSSDYKSNIKSNDEANTPDIVMASRADKKSKRISSSERTKTSRTSSKKTRKTSTSASKLSESSALKNERPTPTSYKVSHSTTKKAEEKSTLTSMKKATYVSSPAPTAKAMNVAVTTTKATTKATTPPATPTPEPTPIPTPEPTPTPEPAVVAPPADSASYIANTNTGKFHRSGCSSVNKMKDEHKLNIATREDAINGGFVPCKICKP